MPSPRHPGPLRGPDSVAPSHQSPFSAEPVHDPARSLYTVFQIFTLEGWNQYPEKIEARLLEQEVIDHGWIYGARIFFSAAVLIGGILGFSLANAVFIDEMTLDNNRALEAKIDSLSADISELRALFSSSLTDSGAGSPPDFQADAPASTAGEGEAAE